MIVTTRDFSVPWVIFILVIMTVASILSATVTIGTTLGSSEDANKMNTNNLKFQGI